MCMKIAVACDGLLVAPLTSRCESFTCYAVEHGIIAGCCNVPNMGVTIQESIDILKKMDADVLIARSFGTELDAALEALANVFNDMLQLAEVEKTMQLLAEDIEKTRRRVNALEYVMIPDFQQKIRYISMKLEENERGNITRLMKVKDMVLQEAHEFQQPAS